MSKTRQLAWLLLVLPWQQMAECRWQHVALLCCAGLPHLRCALAVALRVHHSPPTIPSPCRCSRPAPPHPSSPRRGI